MAHVPLKPIGNPRKSVIDDRAYAEHREDLADRSERLSALRAEARAGWGQSYVERVHAKGRLTARERIDRLRDPASKVYEIGTLVNHGEKFGGLSSPAAGVVTAFVRIAGRFCMVIANDNTVASGAWWPRSPEKIERAQAMALRLKVPTIYLVDCSGLFLPEQRRSFGGATGAGHIFKMNSLLSDAGVPQIAGVFGDCIAGGAYMPIISDRVYMTEQAYMVIAGAALLKGAKSTRITSIDIGGPEVHVHESRCADVRVPDDGTLLACIRSEVERLPSSGADYYRGGARSIEPAFPTAELSGLIPTDHREAYAAEEVLARLCDQSLFWEVLPHLGREMICGIGRVGGLYTGFIINRQGLFPDPDRPGQQRPAGILYRDGIAKISAFSRACDADGIPFIWLQDIGGFDIGLEAERHGLLGLGSSLIYTNSTNRVPMFTVLLRKASGAGYYAMAGLPFDPVVQLSMPISRLSVMEGRTLAIASYSTKLDDDFRIKTEDLEERRAIERGMAEVEARIESDMDPVVAASQMDTDEIVQLHELRDWLVSLVEMTYQGSGHRRIKNPRIWSLHDLALLGERGGRSTEVVHSVDLVHPAKPAPLVAIDPESLVFRVPLTGRVYFRPSPDKPPFVAVGDVIARGTTVCLVEAMKSFNRVHYGGELLPERARVVRFPIEDGSDVDQNMPIMELEAV
jgi:acetyl-CoA carboxylase carboxyltransferase component/biotin carboxyl carrier protein